MFTAPFNRTAFNRPTSTDWVINISAMYSTVLLASIGVGTNIPLESSGNSRFGCALILTNGVLFTVTAPAAINADANILADVPTLLQGGCGLIVALLPLCKDSSRRPIHRRHGAVVLLGKDLRLGCGVTAGLQTMAFPFAKKLGMDVAPAALLGCVCDASTLKTLSMLLGVSIPNNASITVDTNVFTSYMGDANLLPVHSGEWPAISRDAVSMTVEGLRGCVSGKMLITPLYL